ncbi:hypothetical protein BDF14DRAFT_1883915 [Spinellus fusiger]|nr:hypothetical protein BDF14DRAFT_1883915 [Spinellus fusiger]
MSTHSPNTHEPLLDYHTANARFQQKLLQAQQLANKEQIEHDLAQESFAESTTEEHLVSEKYRLEEQLKTMRLAVQQLEQDLVLEKEKRTYQTLLSKMTPEQRAQALEEEEKEEEEEEESLKVLFDYLLHVGSTPLPKNAADMSGSHFISPHAELREKALSDSQVQAQSDFTHLHLNTTHTTLRMTPDGTGEIRHCELKGTVYEQWFTVSYDVYGPPPTIKHLEFDLDIHTQTCLGHALQQMKEECHLLGFFRLLIHYARLDHERQQLFDSVMALMKDSPVTVKVLAANELCFHGPRQDDPELVLTWRTVLKDAQQQDIKIAICEQLDLDIRLDLHPSKECKCWSHNDPQDCLSDMPHHYTQLVASNGPFIATHVMVYRVFGLFPSGHE